jgi:hypothetical protein
VAFWHLKVFRGVCRTLAVQTVPARSDLNRYLGNLATSGDAVGRLKAVHQVGVVLRQELEAALFEAELAQVRQARSPQVRQGRSRKPKPHSWEEIGRAIGVSHVQARRRYIDHL